MRSDTLQLSEVELTMLEEVFHVMSKYSDKTREFGVQLVHSHFPMEDGEILYETHDKDKRILNTRPVRITDIKNSPLATAWLKASSGNIQVCVFCCDSVGDDGNTEDSR